MLKEHKKLYKAGKNWVVAMLAVATLGTVAVQRTASADANSNQVSSDVVNNNSDTDLTSAEKNQKTAQADYDQQLGKVSDAQEQATKAQSDANQADQKLKDAENRANGVTDADLTNKGKELESQEKTVKQYKDEKDQADQKVQDYQKKHPTENKTPATNELVLNKITLPDGYADTYNKLQKAETYYNEHIEDSSSYDQVDKYEKKLATFKPQLVNLNSFKHSTADQQIQIKDINNLDPAAQKKLSIWFADLLNQLFNEYDLRNSKGQLLRDTWHFNASNYGINIANQLNNYLTTTTSIESAAGGKESSANSIEVLNYLGTSIDPVADGEELSTNIADIIKNQKHEVKIRNSALGKFASKTDFVKQFVPSDNIKPMDGVITNLDQLKEALYQDVLLFNIENSQPACLDFDYTSEMTPAKEKEYVKANVISDPTLSFLDPLKFEDSSLDTAKFNDKKLSVGVVVNSAGQLVPYIVHIADSYANDTDAQPLGESTVAVIPHATNDKLDQLKADAAAKNDAYNKANEKLTALKAEYAEMQQALTNLAQAQKNDQIAHEKLAAANKALDDEKAKLAVLRQKLTVANKALTNAQTKAVNGAQAEFDKANEVYNKQVNIVKQDQKVLDNAKANMGNGKLWNDVKAQQLDEFIKEYGKEHNEVFQKYDGVNKLHVAGSTPYPNFANIRVDSIDNTKDTIGMSTDGTNNYDYNVVAIYNHNFNNAKSSEFHDTYLFAIHNNKPVTLVDQSTNGGYFIPCNIDQLSDTITDYKNKNNVVLTAKAFQNKFNMLAATNTDVLTQAQEAQDQLAQDQAKLSQLRAAKDSAETKLHELKQHVNQTNEEQPQKQQVLQDTNKLENSGDETHQTETTTAAEENKNNNTAITSQTMSTPLNKRADKLTTNPTTLKGNQNTSTKIAKLPQTGNNNSGAALLLGAVSAMFGFGLLKKKEY